MKKLYILLFLTTTVFSISSMDIWKIITINPANYPYSTNNYSTKTSYDTEIPLHTITTNPIAHTVYTINEHNQLQPSGILYTNPQSEGSSTLVPIYKTISEKSILTIEQNPAIKTISQADFIKEMYNNVQELIRNPKPESLITIIAAMNKAQEKNIAPDTLGKYAYGKQGDNYNYLDINTTVFFGHFNFYIKTTEQLPNINDICKEITTTIDNNRLATTLGFTDHICKTKSYHIDQDKVIKQYPAFLRLQKILNNLKDTNDIYKKFINYIYSPKKNNTPDTSKESSYNDLKKTFCSIIESLANNEFNYKTRPKLIYNAINIIEDIKTAFPEKQEDIISSDILTPKDSAFDRLLDFSTEVKKYSCIICHLIKAYNTAKNTKLTPTPKQAKAYEKKPLYFTYPDSFNSALFDEKIYAFEELKALMHNIYLLKSSTQENRDDCIKLLHPDYIF